MNLFVLGNGFDRAHELETMYMGFRSYLEDNYLDFLVRFEETYGLNTGVQQEHAENILWKEFENNLSKIDEDGIIGNGTSIELGLEGGDEYIVDTLDEHWGNMYDFIVELKDYLKLWIETIDIYVPRKANIINKISKDIFLSFNYTLLLEEVYKIEEERILHIHGSLNTEDYNSLVIGHGNPEKILESREYARKAEESFSEKENSIYNALATYYERTLKNVKNLCFCNSSFFRNLNAIEKVLIIGHSLGEVDLPYFEQIHQNVSKKTIWCIYYYNDEEKHEFQSKLQSIGVASDNIQTIPSKFIFDL